MIGSGGYVTPNRTDFYVFSQQDASGQFVEPDEKVRAAADAAIAPIATAGDLPGLLSRVLVVRTQTAAARPASARRSRGGRGRCVIRSWRFLLGSIESASSKD